MAPAQMSSAIGPAFVPRSGRPAPTWLCVRGPIGTFPSNSEGDRAPMLDRDGGLLRGTLDVLILKALTWGPRHGYAVAEWIRAITDGELLVEEGPLYTALHRLEKNGWLAAEWGYSENNRRAKYYELTRAGRAELRAEMTSWERYARAVGKALAAMSPAVV